MAQQTAMQELLQWVRATLPMDLDTPRMIEEKIESLLPKEKEQSISILTKYHNSLFYLPFKDGEAEAIHNHIVETNEMVLKQIDQDNPVTRGSTALVFTSSQTELSDEEIEMLKDMNKQPMTFVPNEISDEEITKLANEHILYNDSKRQWVIEGMKLYRKQFKK